MGTTDLEIVKVILETDKLTQAQKGEIIMEMTKKSNSYPYYIPSTVPNVVPDPPWYPGGTPWITYTTDTSNEIIRQ